MAARFEGELNKEREMWEEAWKTLEDEHRVDEENLLFEKAAFNAALEEEKGT